MRFCPECKAQYAISEERCPRDGAPLLALPERDELPLERSGLQRLQPVEADNSRYTIIAKIGQGGWGGIYRAYQHSTRREVALKVLRQEVAHDDTVRRRFHREAEAVSRLKHPNTVTTFDFGETPEGLLFIAMEFIEGTSLDRVIEDEVRLPVVRAVRIARQIALSLAEAHEKGIVHRDVKPHNIMLTTIDGRTDFVKVLDFGVAKLMAVDSSLTATGATFGTPEYMSPEQVQSKEIDQRSDLYALGVILYQMLAGAPPFTGNSAVTVALNHVRQRPPVIQDRGDIPRSLLALVKRLLAKDPRDRPQSARELAAELEKIETGVAAVAGRDTPRAVRTLAGVLTSKWVVPIVVLGVIGGAIALVPFLGSKFLGDGAGTGSAVVGGAAQSRPALHLAVPEVEARAIVDVISEGVRGGGDVIAEQWEPALLTDAGRTAGESAGSGEVEGTVPHGEVVDDLHSEAAAELAEAGLDVVEPRPEVMVVDFLAASDGPAVVEQKVIANVQGADVIVDGKTVCETPCALKGRPGEQCKLRVLKRGHVTARRRFTFARESEPLYIELKKVTLSEEDGLKGSPTRAEEDGLK